MTLQWKAEGVREVRVSGGKYILVGDCCWQSYFFDITDFEYVPLTT